ncbi:M16 family metallopeptidase [Pacificimonas flava]|uniref:Peptidase-like protein n=1 Tax=Pacificimonas flava TaxID=1234595 RepID=M2TAV6_9SPHN|nr:pitrilysin family protein [Pacificimonas flava]EMD83734.1 peptidase-like protein [Pacificimonas flava]MBB5280585.1 putative Zn-dependent peptidase [Pacificimonas flava]
MQKLTTLPNGLRIVTREMPSVETVAVGLHCTVGSRYETVRENGLAHLFEHMVFKGAGGRSTRALAEAVEDVGGDLNAMTGREGTVFSARLLAGDLPLGMNLIADMILDPHFDVDELEREKGVVLQELAEVNDMPGDLIFDDLQAAAYPDQPMGRSILGDAASIGGLNQSDLVAWRDRHYRPGEMIVVAAGNLEHDQIVDIAAKRFGPLGGGDAAALEGARFSAARTARHRHIEQAHLTLAWPGPALRETGLFAARLFGEAVGGGMSSRLFQELREERGLAYTVFASHAPFLDTGLFTVYAATAERDSREALSLMQDILRSAPETLTQAELDRARALAKSGLLMSLESCEGQASYIARQLLVEGRMIEPSEVVKRIDAITLDEVRTAGAVMMAGNPAEATIGAVSEDDAA